nr:tiorf77 [Agrobacterium tumefaciens]
MRIDVAKVGRVGADCQDKALSSSRCISREIIIVVSLTFVKDDAARHGGAEGSSIAGRDRRRRRGEEPICGSRQRRQEQIGGAARAGRLRFAMARLDELSSSHLLVWHRKSRKQARCLRPASSMGTEKEPRLSAKLFGVIRPPASGGSR